MRFGLQTTKPVSAQRAQRAQFLVIVFSMTLVMILLEVHDHLIDIVVNRTNVIIIYNIGIVLVINITFDIVIRTNVIIIDNIGIDFIINITSDIVINIALLLTL